MSTLELTDVNSFYGQSHVLFDVSMTVEDGDLVTLIGRNGAGKTTTLRSIMGMVTPKSGEITFDGEDITGHSPTETSQHGIALIPEDRRIFSDLTVSENLRIGHIGHDQSDGVTESLLDDVFGYFPRLDERRQQKAGSLSGGEQQMLTVARALVSDPDLLLVDEPTEGLMPTLVDELSDILQQINDDGMTMLLVEQNVELALDISDYGYVIDEGRIKTHAPSDELEEDEEVKQRYLALG
ncbi:MAG: ABC transporter ATP-binding protein [Haloferacaceae archaeon]